MRFGARELTMWPTRTPGRGDFRPVEIQARQTQQKDDGTGQVITVDWARYATARAMIVPLRTSERFAADQIGAKVGVMYQLKHRISGITHDMRLIDKQDNETVFNITGVRPSPHRGGGQLLECQEYAD